jgi:hypothetical protein
LNKKSVSSDKSSKDIRSPDIMKKSREEKNTRKPWERASKKPREGKKEF